MKYDFSKEDDWWRLIEFVFKAYIVFVCLVYPLWLLNAPDGGFMADGVIRLAISCFISGIFLFGITIVQLVMKKHRRAVFDLMFAALAIAGGALMMPPAMR